MIATALRIVGTQGLSRQRYQRAALAALTAAVSKVVIVVANLAIMPLMLSHLGVERYGIWLTLQSILGMVALVDLGIPNAAQNAMTSAAAERDTRRIRGIASTALTLLCVISATVLVAMLVAWWAMPWPSLLKTTGGWIHNEVPLGIVVFAIAFALSAPLGFVESLSAAFQQASIGNLARTAGAVGALIATWLAVATESSFSVVCIATVGPILLAWVAGWAVALSMHPDVRVTAGVVVPDVCWSLLRSGLAFYGIQLCAVLGFGIDNLLLSALVGPEAVTQYAVPQRIFSIVLVAATVCLAPLWPAYADARARGDHPWISKTLRLSLAATVLLASLGAIAVALALPWLMKHWLGGTVTTSAPMAVGLAVLVACQSIGTAVAFYWNGTSQLRLQFALGLVFVLLAVPLKCLAISRFGIDWLPLVTAIAYVCTILLPAWRLSVSPRLAHVDG
jgi:O-antigen/teichoic acid export membrane protein